MSPAPRLEIDKELAQHLCIALRTVVPQAFDPEFHAQIGEAMRLEDPQARYRRVLEVRASVGAPGMLQAALLDQLPPESRRKLEEGLDKASKMVEDGYFWRNENSELNELSVSYPIEPKPKPINPAESFENWVLGFGPEAALAVGIVLVLVGCTLALVGILAALVSIAYAQVGPAIAAFVLVAVGIGLILVGRSLLDAADKADRQRRNLAAHFQWRNGGEATLKAADGSWSYSMPSVISGDTGYAF